MTITKEYIKHHGRFAAIAIGTALALAATVPVSAETIENSDIAKPMTSNASDAWQFEITPYILAAGATAWREFISKSQMKARRRLPVPLAK